MNDFAQLGQTAVVEAPYVCPAEHPHGKTATTCYTKHKCRCDRCRSAVARAKKDIRRQITYGTYVSPLVPALGSHRRLQALQLNGWSMGKIAPLIDRGPTAMSRLLSRGMISRTTHDKIAEVFDELWNVEAPQATQREKQSNLRARNTALAKGFHAALEWDDIDTDVEPPTPDVDAGIDPIAVEFAVAGRKVPLTHDEKLAAIPGLHARRWSAALISQHLGLSERTIQRERTRLELHPFPYSEIVQAAA